MNIRNFAIIAHVDHGKSTLADRLLEITGVVKPGDHEEQLLDRNPISRERGITIKLAPVRMEYNFSKSGPVRSFPPVNAHLGNTFPDISSVKVNAEKDLQISNLSLTTLRVSESPSTSDTRLVLNLIDTPGHVDFSYEVDRTLACVEGAILLVDATQGVQAQTIANAYKAIEKNLVIIPAVNKIDMPNSEIEKTKQQIIDFLGFKKEEIFEISAKTGHGVCELLNAVIEKVPPPVSSTPQALIFDSYYDTHRGIIAFVRVFGGGLNKHMKTKLGIQDVPFTIEEVGYFLPDLKESEQLAQGEIGYVVTNLKDIHQVRVGDTIATDKSSLPPLAGYKRVKPMVYASVFPTDTNDYLHLKKALEKLYLNDSALEFVGIYSKALGAGFRVGFLGLLHADVVRERLEREFNLNLILTPPQVEYKKDNKILMEPWVKIMIITPHEYLGAVMQIAKQYRARFITMDNKNQMSLHYEMPLSEMIGDFFDSLKSISQGYASLDWEFVRFEPVEAEKLAVLLNGDEIEEFSEVVVRERALERGMELTKKIREIIPRQQFEIRIQAQYKGKIISSERIAPFRKDVTKKLYGGDRTRKDKLLEKQKEGKKKMKMVGSVEIPKEAFLKLFRR